MTLTWRTVFLLISAAFFTLAAFGVTFGGEANLVLLGVAAYVVSLLDVASPRPPA